MKPVVWCWELGTEMESNGAAISLSASGFTLFVHPICKHSLSANLPASLLSTGKAVMDQTARFLPQDIDILVGKDR